MKDFLLFIQILPHPLGSIVSQQLEGLFLDRLCLPFGRHFYFMEKKGFVYILTNPCFKENWVKIGQTDNLDRRIWELSQTTGIPLPFEIYAVLKTAKYKQAEHMIHRLIGNLHLINASTPKENFLILSQKMRFQL